MQLSTEAVTEDRAEVLEREPDVQRDISKTYLEESLSKVQHFEERG